MKGTLQLAKKNKGSPFVTSGPLLIIPQKFLWKDKMPKGTWGGFQLGTTISHNEYMSIVTGQLWQMLAIRGWICLVIFRFKWNWISFHLAGFSRSAWYKNSSAWEFQGISLTIFWKSWKNSATGFNVGFPSLMWIEAGIKVLGTRSMLKNSEATYHLKWTAKLTELQVL